MHDGWGIAPEKGMDGDAIDAGTTTNMDTISEDHSHRTLYAHGLAVGLSDGLMGNSEVGYAITRYLNALLLSFVQTFKHRRWSHRLAGYRPYRPAHQEAGLS